MEITSPTAGKWRASMTRARRLPIPATSPSSAADSSAHIPCSARTWERRRGRPDTRKMSPTGISIPASITGMARPSPPTASSARNANVNVGSLRVIFATFNNGGWFGPPNVGPGANGLLTAAHLEEPIVQITRDGGTNWSAVPHTSDYLTVLVGHRTGGGTNPSATWTPAATFMLSEIATNVNGVRLIGREGGHSQGFVGVFDLSVFPTAYVPPDSEPDQLREDRKPRTTQHHHRFRQRRLRRVPRIPPAPRPERVQPGTSGDHRERLRHHHRAKASRPALPHQQRIGSHRLGSRQRPRRPRNPDLDDHPRQPAPMQRSAATLPESGRDAAAVSERGKFRS
jgi:hypothetical protein